MIDISGRMRLYLITDDSGRSVAELTDRVTRGIAGGATAVQFREKNCGPTVCARSFEAIAQVCAAAEVPLFLNADLLGRFALNGPFAGYHYSSRTLPPQQGPLKNICGYSAHSPEDARTAFFHHVHFCTLSPIFATPSKQGILNPIELSALTEARELLPEKIMVALGGINETNAGECMRAGASGIGVIRAIMAADDPELAARRLLRIVENSKTS